MTNPVSEYYKDYEITEQAEQVVYKNATELLLKYTGYVKAFPNKKITFNTLEAETLNDFDLIINTSSSVNLILNLTLKGSSTIKLEGSNYSVHNLTITEGDKTKVFGKHIVQVKGDGIKMVNFSMVNFEVKDDDLDYVRVQGKKFELHNSLIQDKVCNGVFLRLDFPDNYVIKQCVFKNFKKPNKTNGGEMVRCATSQYEKQKSFCVIDSCYFEKCDGDPEVVSIKCSNITVKNCIFTDNQGKLVLRHAHNCVVENNYFSDNGVRVYGTNHKFLKNQLDNNANILLDNKSGNSYVVAKDCIVDGLYYTDNVSNPITNKGVNCKVSNVRKELVITEKSLYTNNKDTTTPESCVCSCAGRNLRGI